MRKSLTRSRPRLRKLSIITHGIKNNVRTEVNTSKIVREWKGHLLNQPLKCRQCIFYISLDFWRRWLPNRPLQSFKQFFSAKDYIISNSKWTDSKLLLLEISICRNCPSVGCLKCVQFHNWFRLHLIQAKIIKKSATIAFSPILFPHPCFFYFSFAFSLLVWFLSLSGAKNPCLLALHFLTQECKWLQSVLSRVRG